MALYRLYVDESGDHTYSDVANIDKRYLGLTGIAVETNHYRDGFHPEFEALKQRHFPHSPDEPVVLVRNLILNKKGPFYRLQDSERQARWGDDFCAFLSTHSMVAFTVVLDKQQHQARYGKAAFHPYHFCLAVLIERYRGYLQWCGGKGDVLAESRGGNEDRALKMAYSELWEQGTYYLSAQQFRDVLTSKELKVKRKEQNIAGLQIADLLAYPSKIDVLRWKGRELARRPGAFTDRLIELLGSKYNLYGRVLI